MDAEKTENPKFRKNLVMVLTPILCLELAFIIHVAICIHDFRLFPWRWDSEAIFWAVGFGWILIPLYFVVVIAIGAIACWFLRPKMDSLIIRTSLISATIMLGIMIVSIVISIQHADPTPLRTAVEEGNLQKVNSILSKGTTELDEGNWLSRKKSLVRVASEAGHTDICRLLIEHGAHVNGFRDSIVPYRQGNSEIVNLLHEFRVKEIEDYGEQLEREGKDPHSGTEALAGFYSSGGWIFEEEFLSLAGVGSQK